MKVRPLSKLAGIPKEARRTLDFDLETVAAGYADPAWVPDTITAYAFSWVGSDEVECGLLPVESFYDRVARRRFLEPMVAALLEADVVTGHNIVRFDLRVLSAEVMKLGMPSLPALMVQDTMRLPRAKGFKKGQDNLAHTLGLREEKLPLNWAQWEEAYGEPGMPTVRDRVVGDVVQHKALREAMRARGWLAAPRLWRP